MRRFHDQELDAEEMSALKKKVGPSATDGTDRPMSPIVTRPETAVNIDKDNGSDSDNEEEGEFTNSFLSCCRAVAPLFTVISTLILLVWVGMTSGTYSGSSTPKVALVVFEGLRGDLFQQTLIAEGKLPFLKALLQPDVSSYATCVGIDDPLCARTQTGAGFGAGYTFGAAPGIASILTGVNSQRHMVTNDTTMTAYATTAATYPSLPMHLKSKGMKTAAVGTSKLLTTLADDGTCSAFGVLDYECGVDLVQRCFRASACNLDARVLTPTTIIMGEEEINMVHGIRDALVEDPSLLIFHTSKLARGAADPSRPGFSYDMSSQEYMAELYQLDAVIGQLVAELRARGQMYRENWLLVGTSAHGGYGKNTGTITGWDEIIPFFVAPLTSAAIRLNPLASPASQMDVYPTVLQWLGVAGPANVTFDGQVQGICTDGSQLRNCTH